MHVFIEHLETGMGHFRAWAIEWTERSIAQIRIMCFESLIRELDDRDSSFEVIERLEYIF